jgi:hypothetical protein
LKLRNLFHTHFAVNRAVALSAILRTALLKLESCYVALFVDGLSVLAHFRFFERNGFAAKGALDERIKYLYRLRNPNISWLRITLPQAMASLVKKYAGVISDPKAAD